MKRRAAWLLLLAACGARTGSLADEEAIVPDAAAPKIDASVPADAGRDAPRDVGADVRDAGPDVGCDACVKILANTSLGYYEIHAPEGTFQQIGPTPDAFIADLAITPDKKTLYGGAYGGIATIDMTTWKTIATARTDPNQLNALEIGADGTMYGAEWDTVYTVDPHTGLTTSFAKFPPGHRSAGDLAFLGARLYATTFAAASNALVEVDVASRTTRIVGDTHTECIFGLVGGDTLLYGVTCNGELIEVDPATAAAKILAKMGDPQGGFLGAARL